jgi:hypothetical protein
VPDPPRPRRPALVLGFALSAWVALAGTALAGSLNLVEPASSPETVGASPKALVATDLDGDADRDLAVANASNATVTILKNNGTGNFAQPATSPESVGTFPDAIAAADLDGDGDRDLAVANQVSGNVTILKNNGTGNFNQPLTSPEPAGTDPVSIVAADLDGDNDRDLVVANATSDNLTILKNNGSGSFSEPLSSPELATGKPISLAVADLDGDGDRDLAVAEQQAQSVRILRNSGKGNFSDFPTSPEATSAIFPQALVLTNLNQDSSLDLAVAHQTSPTGFVSILKGAGGGDFAAPPTSPESAGTSLLGIAAADIDVDGDTDLAIVNSGDASVTVLGNNGMGNFFEAASSPETVGMTPDAIIAADFDSDGDADLAIANANGASVTILRNISFAPA